MRWVMKQWKTFEFTNIKIEWSFAFMSKRNHVFDIRLLFSLKQNNRKKSLRDCDCCSYELFDRLIKFQSLNVFLLKNFSIIEIWFDERIFVSTNIWSFILEDFVNDNFIKNDFFESINCSNSYDFKRFSSWTLFEMFNSLKRN